MTDVEHISRKGSGVPVSWFPVPETKSAQAALVEARRQVRLDEEG